MENHWGVSSDIDLMLAIFHEVWGQLGAEEQGRFRICLDPENMAEKNRPENWAKMAPWAGHVHLKGETDAQLMAILADLRYLGPYTQERSQLSPH